MKATHTQKEITRDAVFDKASRAILTAAQKADSEKKEIAVYLRPNGRVIYTAHPLNWGQEPLESIGDDLIGYIYPKESAQDLKSHIDYLKCSIETAADFMRYVGAGA